MKLVDAMQALADAKKARASAPVNETVDTPRTPSRNKATINHHRGVIHVMGINNDSDEYEEMSRELDDLAQSNPALYHRIVSMD